MEEYRQLVKAYEAKYGKPDKKNKDRDVKEITKPEREKGDLGTRARGKKVEEDNHKKSSKSKDKKEHSKSKPGRQNKPKK